MKKVLLFFVSFCLCLTMPFVLTSCGKNEEVTREETTQNVVAQKEDLNYTIVLKNFSLKNENSNDNVVIDFAELNLNFDKENGVTGYGYGDLYEEGSKLKLGSVEAVIENKVLYFTANNGNKGVSSNDSLSGRFSLDYIVASMSESLKMETGFSFEEINKIYEDNQELLNKLNELIIEPISGKFVNLAKLKDKIIDNLFSVKKENSNIKYTFDYEKLNNLNHTLATTTLKELYNNKYGEYSYADLTAEINTLLGMKIADIYSKWNDDGFYVTAFFDKLDTISKDIGELLNNLDNSINEVNAEHDSELTESTVEVQDEEQIEDETVETTGVEGDAIVETTGEELVTKKYNINTFEDLLRLLEVDIGELDISNYLTTPEFTNKYVYEIINQLIDKNFSLDIYRIIIPGFVNMIGEKTVYEMYNNILELYLRSEHVESLFSSTPTSYYSSTNADANVANNIVSSAYENFLKQIDNYKLSEESVKSYIDKLSQKVNFSYTLNQADQLIDFTIDIDNVKGVSFTASIVANKQTNHNYSQVIKKIDNKLYELKITKDKLPDKSVEDKFERIETQTENGSVITFNVSDYSNTKYNFEFDKNGNFVAVEEIINNSVTRIEDYYNKLNILYIDDEDCNDILLVNLGSNNSATKTIQLEYDTKKNVYTFNTEEKEHHFIEMEERKQLGYGVYRHFVCTDCKKDYYIVTDYVADSQLQDLFNSNVADKEKDYVYDNTNNFLYEFKSTTGKWEISYIINYYYDSENKTYGLSSLTSDAFIKSKNFSNGDYTIYTKISSES